MMRGALIAAATVCMFGSGASAQLTGTTMNINQSFTGVFATVTNGPHVYGTTTIYPDPGFPTFTWQATSPASPQPTGFANSIFCDYTLFALTDFSGETTVLNITGIAVPVATNSARIINSAGAQIGTGTSGAGAISFTILIDQILAGPTPTMTVAWNSAGVACYPDCNGDGVLGLADFGCFQTKFALQDPYADCNGDGVLGLADFGCFQTKFALGCP
jgi:hypothetical protein